MTLSRSQISKIHFTTNTVELRYNELRYNELEILKRVQNFCVAAPAKCNQWLRQCNSGQPRREFGARFRFVISKFSVPSSSLYRSSTVFLMVFRLFSTVIQRDRLVMA